jgi:hypothetical protein
VLQFGVQVFSKCVISDFTHLTAVGTRRIVERTRCNKVKDTSDDVDAISLSNHRLENTCT